MGRYRVAPRRGLGLSPVRRPEYPVHSPSLGQCLAGLTSLLAAPRCWLCGEVHTVGLFAGLQDAYEGAVELLVSLWLDCALPEPEAVRSALRSCKPRRATLGLSAAGRRALLASAVKRPLPRFQLLAFVTALESSQSPLLAPSHRSLLRTVDR